MKKILLCPPAFYDIEYVINPWMNVKNKVDKKKVLEEYEDIKRTYKSLGVEVLEIDPEKGLPDMVYAANLGFVKDNIFIKSNFKYPQRQSESIYSKKYFEKLGFEIKELPKEISFEGQGDLLYMGGKYFMGYGKRSSLSAKKYIENFLKGEVFELKLSDPYFYHCDMSFAPLNDKTAVINKHSFDKDGLEMIYKNFPNIILAGESDNNIFSCNLVVVDKNIVIGKGISDKLKNDFARYGFTTHEVDIAEYRKGGGSIKCLTLEFF
jgi:N-dimethylarginine dimethylaminohydrolase